MGVTLIDPVAYGKLLSIELPRPIENAEEFERMAERLEALDFPHRSLTPEETALRDLLTVLVKDYDEKTVDLPEAAPHEVLQFLMDQHEKRQADLVPIVGSRAQVSDLVNGRRGISKAQAKKLAAYFNVSVEVFL